MDADLVGRDRELAAAAGRLTARLTARLGPAAGDGRPVAICTDRPADAVVAMLAVLSSGRAYTVVPPTLPDREQRRRHTQDQHDQRQERGQTGQPAARAAAVAAHCSPFSPRTSRASP